MARYFPAVLLMVALLAGTAGAEGVFNDLTVVPRIATPNNPVVRIRTEADGLAAYSEKVVTGRVYDITGREVGQMEHERTYADVEDTFADNAARAGTALGWETLVWDIGSNPSGVYIYQLKGNDQVFTGTFVVAR